MVSKRTLLRLDSELGKASMPVVKTGSLASMALTKENYISIK